MKPHLIIENPPEWNFCTSNCIALDRLVEVALSPTGTLSLHSSFRNYAKTLTPEVQQQQVPSKFYTKSDGSRDIPRDGAGGGDDGDSAGKRRYCCNSNGINKLAQPVAAPSPSSPSPSSSEAPNHHHHQSAGYLLQQQQQQKLKRRLSSFNEISTPAARRSSSSSLRVHVEHPHAKRFKLTPRFKALVDISC